MHQDMKQGRKREETSRQQEQYRTKQNSNESLLMEFYVFFCVGTNFFGQTVGFFNTKTRSVKKSAQPGKGPFFFKTFPHKKNRKKKKNHMNNLAFFRSSAAFFHGVCFGLKI